MKTSQRVLASIGVLFISTTSLAGEEVSIKKQKISSGDRAFHLIPQVESQTELNSSEKENVQPIHLTVSIVPRYIRFQFTPGVSFTLKFSDYQQALVNDSLRELMIDQIKTNYGILESAAFAMIIQSDQEKESKNQRAQQQGAVVTPLPPLQGSFFCGDPDLAENATPEESEFYKTVLQSLESLQEDLTPTEYDHAGLTIHSFQSFHEYNQLVCRELYSYNTTYSRIIPGVALNPHNSDIPAHQKAKYFYNQLKLAYEFASQDKQSLIRFFRKAFTELGCLEAASQMISNWYFTVLKQAELLRSGEKVRLALRADFAVFELMNETLRAAIKDYMKQNNENDITEVLHLDPYTDEEPFRNYFPNEKLIEILEKQLLNRVGTDDIVINSEKIRELVQLARP